MGNPEGIDWLWAPLENSIQEILNSWKKEYFRLRRDVAFKIETVLEENLTDEHLVYPNGDSDGKTDLYIGGLNDEHADLSVHLNGGSTWPQRPVKFGELEESFHYIADLLDEKKIVVGMILIFDEDFYPEKFPAYEKVAEELGERLAFKYTRLTARNALCHIWWRIGGYIYAKYGSEAVEHLNKLK